MSDLFYKGIALSQRKDPALSRELREFLNADSMGVGLEVPSVEDPLTLPAEVLLDIAQRANIMDERDGVPLADKLRHNLTQQVQMVVVDAMDDEPFVSSQLNPILKNKKLAQKGLALCKYVLGAEQACFAVYKNLTDMEIRIPRKIGEFPVRRLRGRYPAEFHMNEKAQLEGNTPSVLVGAGAVLHFARAVYYGKPQTTAFITVAGDCISNPMNLEVSLGMTVTQILERCGLQETPHRVVVGGSMTGTSIFDTDQTTVTHTTRAVLAFREDLVHLGLSCIGCGRCVRVCPQGLNPYLLFRSIQQSHIPQYANLDAKRCIHCGTCSYICPAKLNLSDTIFHSYAALKSRVSAFETQQQRAQQYENTKYNRYLMDFLLGKAVQRYYKDRKNLAAAFIQNQKQAEADRSKRDAEIDNTLQSAQRTWEQRQLQAEAELAKAKAVFAQLERSLQEEMDALLKARDAAYTLTDKALEELKAHQRISEELAPEVRELLQEEVHRAAEKQGAVLRKRLERLENKGDNADKAQLASCKKACAEAEKSLSAKDKQLGSVGDALGKDTQAHLALLLEDTHHRCEQRRTAAENAVKAAELQAQDKLRSGKAQLVLAEQACTEAKHQAKLVWEQAQRDAMAGTERSDEQLQADRVQVDKEGFSARADMDVQLQQARTAALQAAYAYAQATADLMGRQVLPEDFVPPANLVSCEKALLSKTHRLPIEDLTKIGQASPEEKAQTLCDLWKSGGDKALQAQEEVLVSA